MFTRFDIPEVSRTDCGTQFLTDLGRFESDLDFEQVHQQRSKFSKILIEQWRCRSRGGDC